MDDVLFLSILIGSFFWFLSGSDGGFDCQTGGGSWLHRHLDRSQPLEPNVNVDSRGQSQLPFGSVEAGGRGGSTAGQKTEFPNEWGDRLVLKPHPGSERQRGPIIDLDFPALKS